MGAESKLGKAYRTAYEKLCGRHPYQRLWHFQWLSVIYLHGRLKRILPEIEGRVLDVGCGNKPYDEWIQKRTEYVGLDIKEGLLVDIVVDAYEVWPLRNESFDSVISIQVFEHVECLEHTISEIDRVLKPNGTVILAFPFLYNEHGAPFDFLRFTKHAARTLFPGYEVQVLETLGGVGSTLGQLLLNWIEAASNGNRIFRFLKGPLLPVWVIFAFLVNIFSRSIDFIDNTGEFYSNILLVARKP